MFDRFGVGKSFLAGWFLSVGILPKNLVLVVQASLIIAQTGLPFAQEMIVLAVFRPGHGGCCHACGRGRNAWPGCKLPRLIDKATPPENPACVCGMRGGRGMPGVCLPGSSEAPRA